MALCRGPQACLMSSAVTRRGAGGAFDRGSPQRTGVAQRSAVPQPLGPGRSFKGLGVVKRYCSTDLIGNTTSHRAESQEGLLPGSLSAGASYFCASALNSRPPRSARSSATSARSSGTALETIDFPGPAPERQRKRYAGATHPAPERPKPKEEKNTNTPSACIGSPPVWTQRIQIMLEADGTVSHATAVIARAER